MVERNLIREGYIYNTRTPLGTISGSQTVDAGQIDALFDEDVSTTALVVTGTKFIALDADLGGRWKLKRIELYTDEPTSSNLDMFISDDGVSFTEITMTGTPPLWVGDISALTTSGSPRYIRYEHRPSSNRNIREWKAINEDAFVDFGSDGSQTSLTLNDAPIGRVSDAVTPLAVFNNYSKPAEAFVFVDRTDNAAENEIEISKTTSGPWAGRASATSVQPEITPWEDGEFFQTRIVPSGTYAVDFTDGDLKSWAGDGATVSIVGSAARGVSTSAAPRLVLLSAFQSFIEATLSVDLEEFFTDYITFRAADVDKVKVRAKVVSSIPASNLVEGPRLFWRNQEVEPVEPFRNTMSALSQAGSSTFTGQIQDFIFDVGAVPTWSGTIRGFGFRPFTVATGTGYIFDMYSVEAYNSAGGYVTLDFNPVSSGTFSSITTEEATSDIVNLTILSTRHTVQQDCIISRVTVALRSSTFGGSYGIFLARPNPGTAFPLRGPGNNFTLPHAMEFFEGGALQGVVDVPVFWSANKGDIVGIAVGNFSSAGASYITTGAVAGDAWVTISGIVSPTTLANFQSGINNTDWTSITRHYLLSYEAIATPLPRTTTSGGYVTTGMYRTPVFDSSTVPTLNMLDFESVEPTGTSIDSLTQAGVRTVKARAGNVMPRTSLALGERGRIDTENETIGLFLNSSSAAGSQLAVEQINTKNGTVGLREGATVQNVGSAILYHETNDELWVLNTLLSGTNPFNQNDARPCWDVFDPHTGEYVRTQHMTGDIFHSYDHPTSPGTFFEPVGFVADYGRGEIYVVQRENAVFVGAGTYYGFIMDLDGEFQDVFWRHDTVGTPTNRQETITGLTYAPTIQDPDNQVTISGVFFTLNDNSASTPVGDFLTAFRNGTEEAPTSVSYINEVAVASIPKLTFATAGSVKAPTGIAFNPIDSRLYLYFDFVNSTTVRQPFWFSLNVSYNTSTDSFQYSVAASGSAEGSSPLLTGFVRGVGASDDAEIDQRALTHTAGAAYVNSKDTFAILKTYNGDRSEDYPDTDFDLFDRRSLSFIYETGAGTITSTHLPRIPATRDGLWGSISGTLGFDDISTQGINYPTGRYSQIEYQLNSDSARALAPKLLSSIISSGLSIGTIPADGSKEIFVRTNIDSDKPIGDQQGRLKVFFEMEE